MNRLSGKIAVITGAAGGMGLATARLFHAEGAKVVMTDLQGIPDDMVQSMGQEAIFLNHDVTAPADWARVLDATRDSFGTPDILVNNAGILRYGTIIEMPIEEFMMVMRVNMAGTYLGVQTLAPAMIEKGAGSIVNVSSIGAMGPTNATAAYASSKAAVRGFTKVAALELGVRGVRVNSIHPGGVDTPMTNPNNEDRATVDSHYAAIPAQRAGRPDEIAAASLFLASDEASYCNGTEFVVDGGFLAGTYVSFLPGGLPVEGEVNS